MTWWYQITIRLSVSRFPFPYSPNLGVPAIDIDDVFINDVQQLGQLLIQNTTLALQLSALTVLQMYCKKQLNWMHAVTINQVTWRLLII